MIFNSNIKKYVIIYNRVIDMNKKGFSLIELLAVIVIIGIIALITFPIVDDIISNSEKKAFKASVDELVNLTEMDYNEFGRTGVVVYTLNNKKLTCNLCTNNIKYNGEIEDGTGTITLENGKLTDIVIQNKYYKADLNENNKIEVNDKE